MKEWIIDVMNQFGYVGVAMLIAIENLFPPIPSEVILTFGGYMTTLTDMTVLGVVIASTVGSVVGACILYGLGTLLDVERLEKIVDKWGRVLRLTKEDIHKAQSWFDKYGPWTVFFCRFIPLIRSLISIPAGMARMPFGLFLLLTTIGTTIWNTVLVSVGASVGASWESILAFMDVYSNITYVLIVIVFVTCVAGYIVSRVNKAKKNEVNKSHDGI